MNTADLHNALNRAYETFNVTLFESRLPDCVILLHRKRGAYGYFWAGQWEHSNGDTLLHEIALNPATFKGRTETDVLSTLVHEMCHLEQQVFGKPSRNGYHNKEWARMMERVGLVPTDTGKPGGKQTGQKVTHYVAEGGPFAMEARRAIDNGFRLNLFALPAETGAKKKDKSKVKFSCPSCDAKAWAKESANLVCGDCETQMINFAEL